MHLSALFVLLISLASLADSVSLRHIRTEVDARKSGTKSRNSLGATKPDAKQQQSLDFENLSDPVAIGSGAGKPSPVIPSKDVDSAEQMPPATLAIARSNNDFTFKLYRSLIKTNGENLLYAPLSLLNMLLILKAGSTSKTEREIASVLGLQDMQQSAIDSAYLKLLTTLDSENNTKSLNAVLIDEQFELLPTYTKKLRAYYNTYLEKVGFSVEPEYVQQWANELANWYTDGKIQTILADVPNTRTKMLLVNAVYFKSQWATPFDSQRTRKMSFFNANGVLSKVFMMRQTANFGYYCDVKTLQLCAVDVPYERHDKPTTSMLILMPNDQDAFERLQRDLSDDIVQQVRSSLKPEDMQLIMPKFSITGEYDLLKPFVDLGMSRAFSSKGANFSRISPNKDLFIQNAKHSVRIDVDEVGTTSAATTLLSIGTRRARRFKVNRPFVFLIINHQLNTILFAGQITNL